MQLYTGGGICVVLGSQGKHNVAFDYAEHLNTKNLDCDWKTALAKNKNAKNPTKRQKTLKSFQ